MNDFKDKIEEFKNYLLINKKYSNATIESYGSDLIKYYEFNKNKTLNDIKSNDIKEYLKLLKKVI